MVAEAGDQLLRVRVPQPLQARQLLLLLPPELLHVAQVSLSHLRGLTLRLRQLSEQSLRAEGAEGAAAASPAGGSEPLTCTMSSRMST